MPVKQIKSCLVITYGPVPTPQYQTIEGGGMRAWGLATGLKRQGMRVTVAVNASFPQKHQSHESINLVNWSLDDKFKDLLNSYDAVVISYCMGDPSVFVVNNISDNVLLILDAYVPIYVEVSARDSKDIDSEYVNYAADIKRFNHVLKRGDYFLCASESQKIFYTGVLGSLGIVNPHSYRKNRILIVPFGIHDLPANPSYNPYEKLGIKKSDFIVLWFGGLYPWFRVEEFIETIRNFSNTPSVKFVIVGGKNPFNTNPDFIRQYTKVQEFAVSNRLIDNTVYLVDWVDFEDRVNWYAHANLVVSLNQPGEENMFSWRTRVMDYVWGELPIITNGGDPLSEYLISQGAALRLEKLSSEVITNHLQSLIKTNSVLSDLKNKVKSIKPEFYWHKVVEPLVNIIKNDGRPYLEEKAFRARLSIKEEVAPGRLGSYKDKARGAVRLARYAKRKGIRRSAKAASRVVLTQAKTHMPRGSKRYIFISHPIDNTGAPQVLLQILEEYSKKYGAANIQLLAPHILANQLRRLREEGVKVDKAAAELSSRLIALQTGLKKNDFVLMNTAAIYHNYYEYVLSALESGKLNHAYWFIHEDKAQLPGVNPSLLHKAEQKRIRNLVTKNRLTILVPSKRTKLEYDKLFDIKSVKAVELHVDVPDNLKKPRSASSYGKIDFLLQGSPADGRKGQMIAIPAFYDFMKRYYEKNPSAYRNFRLHLVAIGDDYISQQIRWVGKSLLASRVSFYPSLPYLDSLNITHSCNAVICCSLNETFGLSVAEGMLMHHVVLRNNSAGVDEQLKEGVNGYSIDHTDVPAFADVIEKILNRKKTSDKKLQSMGIESKKIIEKYQKHSYIKQIEN